MRRLEAVFNRHDPASPVAALNRCRPAEGSGRWAADPYGVAVGSGRVAGPGSSGVAAGSGSGRVRAKVADDDLWFLLEIGEQFRKATFGYFDLAALSNREVLLQATHMNAAEAPFRLLHSTHEIELRRGCILDFGGIAKGYALEKVRNILKAAGVENALLNFGGSSVLGMGHHPLGPCWEVAPEGTPPSAPSLNTAQNRDGNPKNNAPSLNTPQFRDGTPETAEPFLNTPSNRNRTPETAEPFLETTQNRNRTPENAEPFLKTAQNRNHSPENAEPSLNTPQFRDGTPETAEPFLETTQNRNHSPEITEPFLKTAQSRNHSPETTEPSLNTPQFRDGNPENAEPFLNTPSNRNRTPETAEPFLETTQNRNHSPETTEPFLKTAQSRNHSPETAEPFLNTPSNRNRTPENAEPFLNTPSNRNRTPVLRLRDSALSVSGRDREGREHIVDPHTGSPAHHPAAASTNRIAPHTGHPTTQTVPTGRPAPNTGTTPQATRPAAASATRPTSPDGLPATQEDRIPPQATRPATPDGLPAGSPLQSQAGATTSAPHPSAAFARIAVTGHSALVCEILSTALYAAPKELQNEIIANFEGYTTLAP